MARIKISNPEETQGEVYEEPLPDEPVPGMHGGRRPGAGGSTKGSRSGPKKESEQANAYMLLARAKAKRETYRAQLAEMEYKKAAGELIPAKEAQEQWAAEIDSLRAALLALPSRVAPIVMQASDIKEAEKIIREELYEAMEALANGA